MKKEIPVFYLSDCAPNGQDASQLQNFVFFFSLVKILRVHFWKLQQNPLMHKLYINLTKRIKQP